MGILGNSFPRRLPRRTPPARNRQFAFDATVSGDICGPVIGTLRAASLRTKLYLSALAGEAPTALRATYSSSRMCWAALFDFLSAPRGPHMQFLLLPQRRREVQMTSKGGPPSLRSDGRLAESSAPVSSPFALRCAGIGFGWEDISRLRPFRYNVQGNTMSMFHCISSELARAERSQSPCRPENASLVLFYRICEFHARASSRVLDVYYLNSLPEPTRAVVPEVGGVPGSRGRLSSKDIVPLLVGGVAVNIVLCAIVVSAWRARQFFLHKYPRDARSCVFPFLVDSRKRIRGILFRLAQLFRDSFSIEELDICLFLFVQRGEKWDR